MKLNEIQQQRVVTWIAEGLKLSDIQKRLESEFDLRLTYMEVRFLIDDLKLTPIDPAPPTPPAILAAPAEPKAVPTPSTAGDGRLADLAPAPLEPTPADGLSGVKVTVDELTRPGSAVSGKVSFSDGQTADWYLDQYGRLGLASPTKGYKPSPADLQEFQMALQAELGKLGF